MRAGSYPIWTGRMMLAALVVSSAGALAQSSSTRRMKPEAREHLERGRRHFEMQAYEQAIAEFRAGYVIDDHPDFLYALGQAERRAKHCDKAIEAYSSFLKTNPPPAQADLARTNIRRCEEEMHPSPSPEPTASTAPRASAAAPPPPPSTQAPAPAPVASADSEKPIPTTGSWIADPLGGALCAAGIVGAGVAVTLFVVANGAATYANEEAPTEGDYAAARQRTSTLRSAGFVTAGVSAALVAAGVIRYATRPTKSEPPRRARPVGVVVQKGAVVGVVGGF